MAVLEPGLHVMGHQFWPSRVRSQINVIDPVSDPIFVVFARDLLLLLGREYAISGILCTLYFLWRSLSTELSMALHLGT